MAANVEWESLTPEVREHLIFDKFLSQRREHYKTRQDRRSSDQNKGLKHATHKFSLPMFDRSGTITTQSWTHKLKHLPKSLTHDRGE